MERLRNFVHHHMPSGRYEEYRSRFDPLLEETAGEDRYVLEQALDRDARKYSRKMVLRDTVITAGTAGLAIYGGKKLLDNGFELAATLTDVGQDIRNVSELPRKGWQTVKSGAEQLGQAYGRGMGRELESSANSIIGNVTVGLRQAEPQIDLIGQAASDMKHAMTSAEAITGALPDILVRTENVLSGARPLADSLSQTVLVANHMLDQTAEIATQVPGMLDRVQETVTTVNSVPQAWEGTLERISNIVYFLDNTARQLKDISGDLPFTLAGINGSLEKINNTVGSLKDQAPQLRQQLTQMLRDLEISVDRIRPTIESFRGILTVIQGEPDSKPGRLARLLGLKKPQD